MWSKKIIIKAMVVCLLVLGIAGCGRKERPEDKKEAALEQVQSKQVQNGQEQNGQEQGRDLSSEAEAQQEQAADKGKENAFSTNEESGADMPPEAGEPSTLPELEPEIENGQSWAGAMLGTKQEIIDLDEYFSGIQGCAVLYDAEENTSYYYNENSCHTRKSPCSTFKIVSTLMGLKSGVLESKDTLIGYDGTEYATKAWNADLRLEEAFQTSCVWYFRKVIDQIGRKEAERELELLNYGNCDVSEWEGSGVNGMPQLDGFWLESSLQISPEEQVKVLTSIFEGKTEYSEEDVLLLKDIMKTEARDGISVYGKTGTGVNGLAWFVGLMEQNKKTVYFAICLDDPSKKNVTGADAKEIILKLVTGK